MNPEWHCSFQLDGCQGIGLSNYRRHRSADTQWTDLPLPPLWPLAAEQSLQAKASLLRAFLPHLPPGGQQEMEVRWKSQILLANRGSESKIFCWILSKLFSPRILRLSQVTGAGTGGKALQLAEGRTHWPRTDLNSVM